MLRSKYDASVTGHRLSNSDDVLLKTCVMDQITRQRVALLILAGMSWFTRGNAGAKAPAADKLQLLVNDTAAQLQLAYRQHPDEKARRKEQLTAAVAAWRAAPRSEANNEQLATWLRA